MKALKKLNNIHVLSLAGTGIMSVLQFILMATLFRSLSLTDNGIWIFFQTCFTFLDTFRSGFLTTAFVKFYAGATKEKGEEIMGSAWYLASGITLTFILINIPVFFVLGYIGDASIVYFLKFFGINLLCSLPLIISLSIAQGDLKFDRILYIRSSQTGLMLLFTFILIYFHKADLRMLMAAYLLAATLTSLLCIIKGWAGIKNAFKYKIASVKELFNFGKYSVGTTISTNLFGITDTFVINFMLGPAILSVYALGRKLMEIIEIPLRSFVATALPSLSIAYNEGRKTDLIAIMQRYIGMITIGLIPFLAIAFITADLAMSIIGGAKYDGTTAGYVAANIFRLSMMFALFFPADRFLAVTLDVIHKPQINFIKVLIMLVVNLITDVIGILVLGSVYGIIVATIFPTLTGVLIGYYGVVKNYRAFNFWGTYSLGFKELKFFINKTISRA